MNQSVYGVNASKGELKQLNSHLVIVTLLHE